MSPLRLLGLMRVLGAYLCFSLLLSSCGNDSGAGSPGERNESWVVQRVVEGPDGRTSFVHLVDSPGTEALDLSTAREVPGNGRLYLLNGTAYLGDPEALSVVRTRPGELTLVDDSERLSFVGTGISFLPSFAVWVSPEEAFLLDGVGTTGYGWNPTEMTLGREIDLSAIRKDGLEPNIETAVVRDGLLFFLVQQVNVLTLETFEGLQVGVIDLEAGVLSEVLEDSRCIGSRSGMAITQDQTIYIQADNYGAARQLNPDAPSTCILRIAPNETSFDPTWKVDMPDLLDGREASSLIYAGDGIAYVSAVYEEEITIDFEDDPLGFFNQPASRWWVIDLEATTGTEVAELPFHSIAGGNGAVSDGRVFLFTPDNRFEGTTEVWEVDLEAPAAAPTERFNAPGAVPVLGRVNDGG